MDTNFICKVFIDNQFLGTAFLINSRIAYSASHCFEDILDESNCYLNYQNEKYYVSKIEKIDELDFVEIKLKKELNNVVFPEISTDFINSEEKLRCYGYKEVNGEIVGVYMNLSEYPVNNDSEFGDIGLMIEGEVDIAWWDGISGSPFYSDNVLRGIIIRNLGNDGLKTRLIGLSFNKIVNFLVDNNKNDIIENFPNKFTDSELDIRIKSNRAKCNNLYYCCDYSINSETIDFRVNFLKKYNPIKIDYMIGEIEKAIIDYALTLEEKYSEGNIVTTEHMISMYKRIESIKEYMNSDFNSMYILLWMFTEGIIEAPRVARVLIEENNEYIEKDIYLKKNENGITILIPIIYAYEDLLKGIFKILETIVAGKDKGFLNVDDIEWDNRAIQHLDIKTNVKIGKLLRGAYQESIEIEISALVVYNSNLYSKVTGAINADDRKKRFFKDRFKEDLENDLLRYQTLLGELTKINQIKINLFVVPLTDVKCIKNI